MPSPVNISLTDLEYLRPIITYYQMGGFQVGTPARVLNALDSLEMMLGSSAPTKQSEIEK